MKGILKIFLLTCLVLVVACSSFVFAEESEPREPSFFISVNGKTAEENAAWGMLF